MISAQAQSPGRERSDRRERSASPGDAPRANCTQLKIFGDLEPNGSTEGLVYFLPFNFFNFGLEPKVTAKLLSLC